MATTKETAAAKTATTPPVPLTLQQKFIKLREAVPSITQKAHSDGVKYKFAKIFDVYQLLTPAMNEFGVNFDIVGEQAQRVQMLYTMYLECLVTGHALQKRGRRAVS